MRFSLSTLFVLTSLALGSSSASALPGQSDLPTTTLTRRQVGVTVNVCASVPVIATGATVGVGGISVAADVNLGSICLCTDATGNALTSGSLADLTAQGSKRFARELTIRRPFHLNSITSAVHAYSTRAHTLKHPSFLVSTRGTPRLSPVTSVPPPLPTVSLPRAQLTAV